MSFNTNALPEFINHAQFLLSANAMPARSRRYGIVDIAPLKLLRGLTPQGQRVPARFGVIFSVDITDANGDVIPDLICRMVAQPPRTEDDPRKDIKWQVHLELENRSAAAISFDNARVTITGIAQSMVKSTYVRDTQPTVTSLSMEFTTITTDGGTLTSIWKALEGIIGPKGDVGGVAPALKFYFGMYAPENSLGVDGDIYLVQSTDDLLVKIAGVWAIAGNLKGARGPAGIRYAGAWNSSTSYMQMDWVTYDNSSWVALLDNSNVTPVEGSNWTALALKGANGGIAGLTIQSPLLIGNGILSIQAATTTQNGYMSATDKAYLAGLPTTLSQKANSSDVSALLAQKADTTYVDNSVNDLRGRIGPGVQDVIGLRAVASTSIPDRQIRVVESKNVLYRFDAEGLDADDGDMVVKPTDKTTAQSGRWYKGQSAATVINNRGTTTITTASIAPGASVDFRIPIDTRRVQLVAYYCANDSWVRVYGDDTRRVADAARTVGADYPTTESGLRPQYEAETIQAQTLTTIISNNPVPCTNTENPIVLSLPGKVQNTGSVARTLTMTFTIEPF